MSINRVMISGNLTRDAELRTTPSGTSILSFGVAVNDRRRNAIEGRLHYSAWDDRNTGQRRSKVDVTVDELEFMSSRNGGGQGYDAGGNYGGGNYGGQNAGGNYGGQSYQQPQGNVVPEPPTPSAYDDSDIPF